VEIRQVRCFLAVAELRHFGRAAEQLHIVQPAVSQQIRRLERELGVDLFSRTTRTVELTAAGETFLGHAERIVDAVGDASQAIRQMGTSSSTLRVGTSSGLGDLLQQSLEEIARHSPDRTVDLIRVPEQQRLKQLIQGKLSAAIVRAANEPLPDGIERVPIFTDALVAAIPAFLTSPRRRTVRLDELATMPIRLPERDQSPVLVDALVDAYQYIGRTIQRAAAGTDEDMLALIGTAKPSSWTVFYPHKAALLARQSPHGVALRRIVTPSVKVTTFLAIRRDSEDAQMLATALRTVVDATTSPSGAPHFLGRREFRAARLAQHDTRLSSSAAPS
jgi:DNA-binding transcriptional LysR family regulator